MPVLDEKAKRLTEYLLHLTSRFQFLKCDEVPPEYEFNIRELRVVIFLGRSGPSIMRQIADHLGLAMSTATGIVDRLVQKELVRRERPDENRRIVKVELTDKGRQVHQWHFKEHVKFSRGILQSLNEADQEALMVLMSKIIQESANRLDSAAK
jgi:DNA-binding MarR family transcriptional regulator